MSERPRRRSGGGSNPDQPSANGAHEVPDHGLGLEPRTGPEPDPRGHPHAEGGSHPSAGHVDGSSGPFGSQFGWDRPFEVYTDFDLPTYVGPTTFGNLPWVADAAEIRRLGADVAIVGAPFDDMVTHRPGARFGPRAIREAQYTSGSLNSLQLDVQPLDELTVVDAGDANIVPAYWERGHAMIYRKVREVAEALGQVIE